MAEDRKRKYTTEVGEIKLIPLTGAQKQEAYERGKELGTRIKEKETEAGVSGNHQFAHSSGHGNF